MSAVAADALLRKHRTAALVHGTVFNGANPLRVAAQLVINWARAGYPLPSEWSREQRRAFPAWFARTTDEARAGVHAFADHVPGPIEECEARAFAYLSWLALGCPPPETQTRESVRADADLFGHLLGRVVNVRPWRLPTPVARRLPRVRERGSARSRRRASARARAPSRSDDPDPPSPPGVAAGRLARPRGAS